MTAWLAALMGVDTRAYTFALADSLLKLAAEGHTGVSLTDLAAPYAMVLVRHLEMPQATQAADLGDSDFLAVASAEASASLATGPPTERLV